MTPRRVLGVALAMAAALAPGAGARAAAQPADPPLSVPPSALGPALKCPAVFAHAARDPVLLVHGTGLDAAESWSWNYARVLPEQGFDTCTVTLPDAALGDIQISAEYVVRAVEDIAARTRRRVDLITHSQGGMEGRWAVRWWPTVRSEVDDLIPLASPNHGIAAADLCADSGNCWPAVWQMRTGANFLRALNSVDETPGTVAFTDIYSRTDELVEPFSTVPLAGGANTANIAVQDICPRVVHHGGLLDDSVVHALVIDAMTHPGPADPSRIDRARACAATFMPGVSALDAVGGNATLYSTAAQAFAAHPGVAAEPPLASYARVP